MKSRILGWKVRINTSELRYFKISFQYNYDFSYLITAVRNGDFLSKNPFFIEFIDGSIYLVSKKKPLLIEIATLPVTIGEEISFSEFSLNNLDMYAITAFYLILSEHNYKRPSEILSFFGRSKGVASKRVDPIKQVQVNQYNQTFTYSIYKAEKFEGHLSFNDEIMIFYDPRYEISEDSFNLTSNNLIPTEVKNEVHKLHRNYLTSIKRFKEISDLIKNHKYKEIQVTEIQNIDSTKIELPEINILATSYEQEPILEEFIESNIVYDNFIKEILFIIDKTGSYDDYSKIFEFVHYFEKTTGIKSTILEIETAEVSIPIKEAYVLIINDIQKGSGYLYDTLKSKIKSPNKVIRFQTIIKEEWNRIINLVWLGIRFRYTKSLYQTVKNENSHSNFVAIHLSALLGGEWLLLTGTSIAEKEVNLKVKSIYNERRDNNLITKKLLLEFLSELINFEENSHFILHFSDLQLEPILTKINEFDFCLTRLFSSNSIYFSEINGEFLPIDGLTVLISTNNSLIMTNGYPNNQFQGIPKPLQMKKIKGIHSIEELTTDIFYQTFMNPYSLSKPKFPFCLGNAMSRTTEQILKNNGE